MEVGLVGIQMLLGDLVLHLIAHCTVTANPAGMAESSPPLCCPLAYPMMLQPTINPLNNTFGG